VIIPRVPLDTLDFTSYTMNLGSKMILDATRKQRPPEASIRRRGKSPGDRALRALRHIDRRIADIHLAHDTLLLVKVTGGGMAVLKKLVRVPGLENVALVAAVSEDVDIRERERYIWGVFTRFDCERDIVFTDQSLMGISPIYGGVMGIDATWKRGYPKALTMTQEIRSKVDERWSEYWK